MQSHIQEEEKEIAAKLANRKCLNCGAEGMKTFYEVSGIPVHSVLLMMTHDEAMTYPKGNINLGFCSTCGFISNLAFNPAMHEYSSKYEETQGFSPTFSAFHKKLAESLIEKYNLRNKTILEIGCGKGEFLNLLCELGDNTGYGFDPAYIEERDSGKSKNKIEFIQDFYSEKYSHYSADFVCCKMTLEHIPNTSEFIKMVRRSIGDRLNTTIFFQIPDVIRLLKELGFWDVYYEHCSYFSSFSLRMLFENSGFEVIELSRNYDDQYLVIEAKPSEMQVASNEAHEDELKEVADLVSYFGKTINSRLDEWRKLIKDYVKDNKKIVVWGGGSKSVAFLTTLGITEEIQYAVDINPFKEGTFLAGSGQKIVSPEFLKQYNPDVVIVMNPIYVNEIQEDLNKMNLNPKILPIDFHDRNNKE